VTLTDITTKQLIEELLKRGDAKELIRSIENDWDNGKKRNENDLDSVMVGSSSRKQVKIYFNSRTDTEEDMLLRIDLALAMANYLEENINGKHNKEVKN